MLPLLDIYFMFFKILTIWNTSDMRGQLLVLTFGLAVLFHGATSTRTEVRKTASGNARNIRRAVPPEGLTLHKIQEIAQSMGVANYEEFSASVGSSEEAPGGSASNEYFSIRRQRATSHQRHHQQQQGDSDNVSSGSAEYQTYQGVMGKPGRDFPVLTHIPKTKFSCRRQKSGYYADLDTDCQVFHICDNSRKISFLCPNGTIFRQSDLICDWWFKVDCGNSPNLYDSSAEHLAVEEQRRKSSNNRRVIVRKRVHHGSGENLNQNFSDSGELVSYEASTYTKQRYQNNANQFSGEQNSRNNAGKNRNGGQQYTSDNQNRQFTSRTQGGNARASTEYTTESSVASRYTNGHQQYRKAHQFTQSNQLYTTLVPPFANSQFGNNQQNPIVVEQYTVNYEQQSQYTTSTPPTVTPSSAAPVNQQYTQQYSTNPQFLHNQQYTQTTFQQQNGNTASTIAQRSHTDDFLTEADINLPSVPHSSRGSFRARQPLTDRQSKTSPTPQVKNTAERKYTHDFSGDVFDDRSRQRAQHINTLYKRKHEQRNQQQHTVQPEQPKENQLPAESASFASNSNKRFYQQNSFTSSNSYRSNFAQNSQSNTDFTRNNVFGPTRSAQGNSRAQNFTPRSTQRTTTRRPVASPSRFSSNQPIETTLNPTTTEFNPEIISTSRADTFNTTSITEHAFTFNESFAEYTTTTSRPVTETTTAGVSVNGHFVTFTYPQSTQSTQSDEKPGNNSGYRDAKFISSGSFQSSVNIPAYKTNLFDTGDKKPLATTPYEPPKIDSLYSRVTKSYAEVQTTEITPELLRQAPANDESTTETTYFYPVPTNLSDPTIYSPEDSTNGFTTTEKPKYSQSVTKYSPTVPTITPRPITPTVSVTGRSFNYVTAATPRKISANALSMLHTLDDLSGKKAVEAEMEKVFNEPRPGLKVPPSSSPDTLHSLAVYFATAADEANNNNNNNTSTPTERVPVDDDDAKINHLLTKSTLEQYNQLFTSAKADVDSDPQEPASSSEIETKINQELRENDLDLSQSQGIVAHESNGTSIRKLARVFTHALSEYLRDPDTFRKVLSEIRPTEPPQNLDATPKTTTLAPPSTTTFTDHPSITKEEGEVLDFSDVVKTTPRQSRFRETFASTTTPYPFTDESTLTTEPTTTTIENLNTLAVELNNEFEISNRNNFGGSTENSTVEEGSSTEDDYFPVSYAQTSASTPSPYGSGLRLESSTPIGSESGFSTVFPTTDGDQITSTLPPAISEDLSPPHLPVDGENRKYNRPSADLVTFFVPEDLNNLAVVRVNDQLSPSDGLLQRGGAKRLKDSPDEEKLQIASSQSFVGSKNFIDRGSIKFTRPTHRPEFKIIVTTEHASEESSTPDSTTEVSSAIRSTTLESVSTTTQRFTTEPETTTKGDDEVTSTTPLPETTARIPEDHWSNSQEVSELLKAAVTLDPEVINRELYSTTGDAGVYTTTEVVTEGKTTTTDLPTTTEGYQTTERTTTEWYLPTERTTTERLTTERLPTTQYVYETTTLAATTTTPSPATTTSAPLTPIPVQSEESIHLAESKNGFDDRRGKAINGIVTKQLVFDLPDVMEKATPEVQMQSAKLIFGGLNTSSQDILMEKMKHADTNKSVRKLVLLLINTCDLNHSRTLEHARKAILNALINVPLEENDLDTFQIDSSEDANSPPQLQVRFSGENSDDSPTTTAAASGRFGKILSGGELTTRISPRLNAAADGSTEESVAATTDGPASTTEPVITTYRNAEFHQRAQAFRQSKRVDFHDSLTSATTPRNAHLDLLPATETDSDTRALELLKSLYGLASRWGRK